MSATLAPTWTEQLTTREVQVARLASEGFTTGRIARELNISPRTAERHITHVYEKLGVCSRDELVEARLAEDAREHGTGRMERILNMTDTTVHTRVLESARAAYISRHMGLTRSEPKAMNLGAEFDRMIAEERRQAVALERHRAARRAKRAEPVPESDELVEEISATIKSLMDGGLTQEARALSSKLSGDPIAEARRSAFSEIHGQDQTRRYSVGEVKAIVYPLIQAIDLAIQMPEADDPEPEDAACSCSGYSEDRGGGYFEMVIEPEPGCPEHGESPSRLRRVADAIEDAFTEHGRARVAYWRDPSKVRPVEMGEWIANALDRDGMLSR